MICDPHEMGTAAGQARQPGDPLPIPDLSDDFVDTLPEDLVGEAWTEWVNAYTAAFMAAVESSRAERA